MQILAIVHQRNISDIRTPLEEITFSYSFTSLFRLSN